MADLGNLQKQLDDAGKTINKAGASVGDIGNKAGKDASETTGGLKDTSTSMGRAAQEATTQAGKGSSALDGESIGGKEQTGQNPLGL